MSENKATYKYAMSLHCRDSVYSIAFIPAHVCSKHLFVTNAQSSQHNAMNIFTPLIHK